MSVERKDWKTLIDDEPTQAVIEMIHAAKTGQQIVAGKAADRLAKLIADGKMPNLTPGRANMVEVLCMALDIQEPKG